MTVPEENRPWTEPADQVVGEPGEPEKKRAGEGRSMRESMQEAGISPEDYEE
ncbi:hypothetical protein ABZ707_06235 [Streptomyces sp. NPDC006923]|uniref:hypothetical protein n=1 Tax=Streptomyces sp. NPDC006923 TaxID=3155355 RepID=UPI0033F259CE